MHSGRFRIHPAARASAAVEQHARRRSLSSRTHGNSFACACRAELSRRAAARGGNLTNASAQRSQRHGTVPTAAPYLPTERPTASPRRGVLDGADRAPAAAAFRRRRRPDLLVSAAPARFRRSGDGFGAFRGCLRRAAAIGHGGDLRCSPTRANWRLIFHGWRRVINSLVLDSRLLAVCVYVYGKQKQSSKRLLLSRSTNIIIICCRCVCMCGCAAQRTSAMRFLSPRPLLLLFIVRSARPEHKKGNYCCIAHNANA
jgi:hypothetical protein